MDYNRRGENNSFRMEVTVRESTYQRRVIRRLEKEFPGCIVLKNDPDYRQGIPDLTVLFAGRWAWLEVKVSEDAPLQPN